MTYGDIHRVVLITAILYWLVCHGQPTLQRVQNAAARRLVKLSARRTTHYTRTVALAASCPQNQVQCDVTGVHGSQPSLPSVHQRSTDTN